MKAAVAIKAAQAVAKGAKFLWRYLNIRRIYRDKRERKKRSNDELG